MVLNIFFGNGSLLRLRVCYANLVVREKECDGDGPGQDKISSNKRGQKVWKDLAAYLNLIKNIEN